MLNNKLKTEEQTSFVMLPKSLLDEIMQTLIDLRNQKSIVSNPISILPDFISEKEAIELLGRKTTWFFNMRKSGALRFRKLGSKVYYPVVEIQKLLKM